MKIFSYHKSCSCELSFQSNRDRPIVIIMSMEILSNTFISGEKISSAITAAIVLPTYISKVCVPIQLNSLFFKTPHLSMSIFAIWMARSTAHAEIGSDVPEKESNT